jgi:probable O-glycosylation ligase (exosortase A-associated)
MLRSLAVALFVLGTLPMAFVEPFVGLLLWVLFSYMNPNRLAHGFATYFHWVFMIAAITLFSMIINRDKVRRIEWSPFSIVIVLFLLSTGISTLFAVEHTYAVAQWTQFFKVQVMVFATLMLVYDRKRLHWMLWVIVMSFGLWGVKGGIFTILKGGHFNVMGPTNTFFGDRNQLALVLCMAVPLMRYLQLQAKSILVRWSMWLIMALTVLSILGTYSRGGLITIVVVTFLLIMKGRRRFSVLFLVLISLPLILNFMPEHWKSRMTGLESGHAMSGESFQGRIQSWQFAANVAVHHPVTGGGFGVWASNKMWDEYGPSGAVHRAIHSIFFQVLGEQGILGFALYVTILWLTWRNLAVVRKRTRGDPQRRWLSDLAGFMQVSLAAYIVAGSALPQAYFDFTYQLGALSVIIRRFADFPEAADYELASEAGLKKALR